MVIGKATKRKGVPGTGGGREAFARGVEYVLRKAIAARLQNLSEENWEDAATDYETERADWDAAATEMLLTCELSDKVQKPYYHVILSWHKHERPTKDQLLAAAERFSVLMGLDEHQLVIGIHDDRNHLHVHIIANLVHPITGKVWSKSKDFQRIEEACRQIEVEQGWTHDRGRFDFDIVDKDGVKMIELRPNADRWAEKTKAREDGRRPKSTAQAEAEKRTGFVGFDHSISSHLQAAFARAVDGAKDWDTLHHRLGVLGLAYNKVGSGARVHLKGSAEYAKASSFGARFSIGNMEKRFGPYKAATLLSQDETNPGRPDGQPIGQATCGIEGRFTHEAEKVSRAAVFKLSLLRRIYTDIYLDPAVAEAIRFVAFDGHPPRLGFKDGVSIVDHGNRVTATADTPAARSTMIAMAKAKGWSGIVPTGSPEFIRKIAIEAAKAGLAVANVPPDIQQEADRILAAVRVQQSRAEIEAAETRKAHLAASAEREAAVARNLEEKAKRTADKDKTKVPDARKVPEPQVGSDRDRYNMKRKAASIIAENSKAELEMLKRTDIGLVADACGWNDVSGQHRDSTDKNGLRSRIYQRGNDTIKATLKGDRWIWTSNKTGSGGSVLDLWHYGRPDKNLGLARDALRKMTGLVPRASTYAPRAEPARSDHTEARRRWEAAENSDRRRNYAVQRGIAPATLRRFKTELRVGPHGSIYFAHRNIETGDIQGFEQRWETDGVKNLQRFAKGGHKTLNVLGDVASATRMVVCEGGLDALALAEHEQHDGTIYVSTAGGFGERSRDALIHLSVGREVISAFDNDTAGEAMDRKLLAAIPSAKRAAPPEIVEGQKCKDWLDVLVIKKYLASPTKPVSPSPKPEQPSQQPDPDASPFDLPTEIPSPSPDDW